MYGVPRGKVLPCRTAPGLLERGVGVCSSEFEKKATFNCAGDKHMIDVNTGHAACNMQEIRR